MTLPEENENRRSRCLVFAETFAILEGSGPVEFKGKSLRGEGEGATSPRVVPGEHYERPLLSFQVSSSRTFNSASSTIYI